MPHKKSSKLKSSKTLLVVIAAVLVVILGIVALEVTDTTHLFHSKKTATAVTGSASSKDSADAATSTSSTSSTGSNEDSSNQATSTPATDQSVKQEQPVSNAALLAPTGTFANVYSATQTETMGSTCNTTPGATCVITFTNGSTVKSLPTKTADAGGGVLWQWTPKDIGLYPGVWSIDATAKLNTQTKTTSNGSLTLEIRS